MSFVLKRPGGKGATVNATRLGRLLGRLKPGEHATVTKINVMDAASIEHGQRARFHDELAWALHNEPQIHYAETRPMPLDQWNAHRLPLTTDCSGSLTSAAHAAFLPDPNGSMYSGNGFTGTLLAHMPAITQPQAQPGDFVFFGPGTADHVAAIWSIDAHGIVLWSHGQERGPILIPLAQEAAAHRGPVRFARLLL